MTAPFRPMTQTCVSAIETSSPAKYSIVSLLFQCQSRSYRLLQKSRDHYPMLKNSFSAMLDFLGGLRARHSKSQLGDQPIC
jgi:hypothetical protein